eukprot:TRINITY_DN11139_c0_g1_i2.p1 TRINITY_DN11139_c0_g1~~TRINITY_DN11139_c0_g1_i2.p1  ORF type:complete len:255 (-),score=10.73 TRINITY_DN11139_c0_g1_i2:323-1087(-)
MLRPGRVFCEALSLLRFHPANQIDHATRKLLFTKPVTLWITDQEGRTEKVQFAIQDDLDRYLNRSQSRGLRTDGDPQTLYTHLHLIEDSAVREFTMNAEKSVKEQFHNFERNYGIARETELLGAFKGYLQERFTTPDVDWLKREDKRIKQPEVDGFIRLGSTLFALSSKTTFTEDGLKQLQAHREQLQTLMKQGEFNCKDKATQEILIEPTKLVMVTGAHHYDGDVLKELKTQPNVIVFEANGAGYRATYENWH